MSNNAKGFLNLIKSRRSLNSPVLHRTAEAVCNSSNTTLMTMMQQYVCVVLKLRFSKKKKKKESNKASNYSIVKILKRMKDLLLICMVNTVFELQ